MNKATLRASPSTAGKREPKMWLKACPRCGGDLYEERDVYGKFIACLQCAYYLTEVEEVLIKYLASRSDAVEAKRNSAKLEVIAGGKR